MKKVFAKLISKKKSVEKEASVLIKNNLQPDIHIEEMTFPSVDADLSYPTPDFKSFSHIKSDQGHSTAKRVEVGLVATGSRKVTPK